MKKSKTKYGKKSLLKREDLERHNSVVSVTLNVPGDLLDIYKQRAREKGKKYTAVMIDELLIGALIYRGITPIASS